MISPSLLLGIDSGTQRIDLAYAIGIDVGVLGNHEFNFGPNILKERFPESKTRWLVWNVSYKGKSGFPGTATTWIAAKGGYKVGSLGLLTPETTMISSAGKYVAIGSMVEAGAALATKLKKSNADIVIALTHDGPTTDQKM